MTAPPPSKPSLPLTLARRVQHLREAMDMTQRQLARKSLVALAQIEDIESGIDLFLAPAIRLRLARALRVPLDVLQEVEKRVEEQEAFSQEEAHLLRQIAQKPDADYTCPRCQSPVVVRVFERMDMEGNEIRVIKAHCSQCLFQIASE